MAKNIVEYILTLKDRSFTRGLKRAALQVRKVDNRTKALSTSISSLNIGIGALVIGFGAFKAVQIAGQFEQTQIAFETMLGSAEKGKKLIQELDVFATKTPFSIEGVQSSAKQLLAMGINVERLLPTLKSLGDVSAGLSIPISRLALNFGQVRSQGKLTGRELRDFAIAGVPLTAQLAKQLNVSTAAISKMVSAGKIGFPEVEQAFLDMSSEGGRFFNLMDKQNKTFLGGVNEMKENFEIFARTIGQTLIPMIRPLVNLISRAVEFTKRHKTAVEIAVKVFLVFAIVIGTIIIAIKLWSFAQAILNVLLLANPVGLIIAGIVILIGIIAAVVTSIDGWSDQWKVFKKVFTLSLQLMKQVFVLQWKIIKNNFLTVLDLMKIAWLKAKKVLGFGSDADKQKIDALTQGIKDRIEEIKNLAKESVKTAKKIKNAFEFKLSFGDESPIDKAKKAFDKLKKPKIIGTGGDGITSETTVTSAAPKVFNINIDKLIETFNVNTQNIKEAPGKVKDMVQQALLEALADIEIIR
ncbi:MAG: tape measure protein [Nitrosopumilus sp.]